LATLRLQRGFGDHFLAACDERPSDGYVAACGGLQRPVVASLRGGIQMLPGCAGTRFFFILKILFWQIWRLINHMLAYYVGATTRLLNCPQNNGICLARLHVKLQRMWGNCYMLPIRAAKRELWKTSTSCHLELPKESLGKLLQAAS
jgi:hypothetical protein